MKWNNFDRQTIIQIPNQLFLPICILTLKIIYIKFQFGFMRSLLYEFTEADFDYQDYCKNGISTDAFQTWQGLFPGWSGVISYNKLLFFLKTLREVCSDLSSYIYHWFSVYILHKLLNQRRPALLISIMEKQCLLA